MTICLVPKTLRNIPLYVSLCYSLYPSYFCFFQDVEAALHVFLDHATLSDHHIRIQLLKELAEDKDICIPHLAELTKTISTLLKVYVEYRMQFTMLRGTVRCGKCNYCYYQCYFYLCCDTNIIITNISLLLL